VAGYSAIADAGETILELLRNRMDEMEGVIDVDRDDVGLASPGEIEESDLRLSLYLYRVAENGQLNNVERERVDDDTYRDPPLAIDLYYLLTAHPAAGGTDDTDRTAQQHRVLGLAMQVLRNNAVVDGSDLRGSLAADDELRISQYPQSVDELTTVWATFQDTPLRPSVSYLVSPVLIDPLDTETIPPVVDPRIEFAVESDPADRE
jgi:hypothetical protein